MKQKKRVPNAIIFLTAIGVSLGLFQFWSFALVFFILGGTVAMVITIMTDYLVNFFFVLFVEYLLMVTIIIVALCITDKKRSNIRA